eukprot:5405372-Amphidinium_carterae.1
MSQRASLSGLPFGDTPSDMHRLQSVFIASSGGIELKSSDALSCSPGRLAAFTSRQTSLDL